WPLLIAVVAPLAHGLFALTYQRLSRWPGGHIFTRYFLLDQAALLWFLPLFFILTARPGRETWPVLLSAWYALFIGMKGAVLLRALWFFFKPPFADVRRGGAAVFTAGLLLYAFLGAQVSLTLSAVGDEPYYLLIAHSLTQDGDWELSNNFARQDYLPFYWGKLNPRQMMEITPAGKMYSNAYQGLQPLLLAPAYWLGGRPGAVLFLGCLSAACLALVYLLALRIGASVPAAFLAWLGSLLCVPVLSLAISPFPETAGAFFLTAALYLLLKETRNARDLAAILACILALLALKNRFVLLVLPLVFGLFRKWTWKSTAGALLVWAGLGVLAVVYDHFVFGGFLSKRLLGQELGSAHSPGPFVFQGHLGLLGDQEFGVLPAAPVFILALAGAVSGLVRGQYRLVILLAGPFLCTWYIMAGERTDVLIWHGGFNPPARYLVASLPALGVLAALALDRVRGRFLWALVSGLFGLTLLYALVISLWPAWRFQYAYGRATFLRIFFDQTGLDPGRLLPSFILPGARWILPLMLGLLLILLWGSILGRRTGVFRPRGSLGAGVLVTALLGLVLTAISAIYPYGEYPATLADPAGGLPFRGTVAVEHQGRVSASERVIRVASRDMTLAWAPRIPAGSLRLTAAVGAQGSGERPRLQGRVGEWEFLAAPLPTAPPPRWQETEWQRTFTWTGGRLPVLLEITNISRQDPLRLAYVRWIRIDRL
ncbi:MAG: hypothetical protein MUF69_11535, partial [Desulfobacterota bacterium]|nr:hypothetical protein [Thermodesulfobacteriota bacterium]